jgi:hypothetical protein
MTPNREIQGSGWVCVRCGSPSGSSDDLHWCQRCQALTRWSRVANDDTGPFWVGVDTDPPRPPYGTPERAEWDRTHDA